MLLAGSKQTDHSTEQREVSQGTDVRFVDKGEVWKYMWNLEFRLTW